jgi:hypothetical protein
MPTNNKQVGLSGKDRDSIRRLQDRLIKALEKEGYKDNTVIQNIWGYNNKAVTLGDLKRYIFPEFVQLFKSALQSYSRKNW